MAATSVREGGPALKGPWDFEDSPLSQAARQPLLLGLFLSLQDIKLSKYPASNSWTFDYNLDLVRRAEELGFELAFSRTQWLPQGGYDGESSLDAFVALGAMAAATQVRSSSSQPCMCSTARCTRCASPSMALPGTTSPRGGGASTS